MPFDVLMIETGNGGDIVKNGNDLAMVSGIGNNPYLAIVGGNLEAVTENNPSGVQSKDYWGNNLIMPGDQSIQFNSITQHTLDITELTSAGRIKIENAFKKDLEYLKDMGFEVEVNAYITATDRLEVIMKFTSEEAFVKVVTFVYKKTTDGDFSLTDFNEDFF